MNFQFRNKLGQKANNNSTNNNNPLSGFLNPNQNKIENKNSNNDLNSISSTNNFINTNNEENKNENKKVSFIPNPKNENRENDENLINKTKDLNNKKYNFGNPLIPKRKELDFKQKIKCEIELSKSEIIERIKKIFLNNASFSKIENDYLITQQRIIDILKKSKLINNNLIQLNEIDIMISEINPKKRKLNLTDFINLITKVCQKIYKNDFQKDPKGIMNYFLNCFFNNYEEILDETSSKNFIETLNNNSITIKSIETIILSKIDFHVAKLILNLYSSFKIMYEFYFEEEMNNKIEEDILQQISLKKLIIFCKDFDIIPYLISENKLMTYYNFVLNYNSENPDISDEILLNISKEENEDLSLSEIRKKNPYKNFGRIYKFTMFLYLFYHFSLITYYKQIQLNFNKKNNKPSEIDILLYFLQRLENSKGINIFIKKKGSTSNIQKITFLPSKNSIEEIKKKAEEENKKIEEREKEYLAKLKNNNNISSEIKENTNNNLNKIDNEKGNILCKTGIRENILIDNNMLKSFNSLSIYNNRNYNLKQLLNLNSNIISLIEENFEGLSELFLNFSKLNDKLTFNRMSLSAYLKFLKYANIVVKIPEEMKKNYLKMGEQIMKKNFNISEIKRFDIKEGSKTCAPLILNETEKDYKNKISQIVNANKKNFDKLSESDASVVFFSLTGTKNFNNKNLNNCSFDKRNELKNQLNIPSKLDFFLFLKSFELISAKLYPNKTLNEAYLELFLNKIIPIIPKDKIINSDNVIQALEKIKNEKIQIFLVKFSPVIKPLYDIHCDNKSNMRFCHFFEFYNDFDLFPDLINLNKLKNIFFTLSESNNKEKDNKENLLYNNKNLINEENKNNNNENSINNNSKDTNNNNKSYNKDYIDFPLFLESLAISAMFFNYKNMLNDMDRMLFLVERIYHSKSMNKNNNKINKLFDDFLTNIKEEYNIENKKNKINDFDQIYNDDKRSKV